MSDFYKRYNPFGGGGGGAVSSVNGQTGVVQLNADDIPYDNTVSMLPGTDVQAAIDELAVLTQTVATETIYADFVNGSDTNSGGVLSPVKTLNKAVSLVTNPLIGYVIRLAPGTYTGAAVAWPPNCDLIGSGANSTLIQNLLDYTAAPASSTNFNISLVSVDNFTLNFDTAGVALPTFFDGSFTIHRVDTVGTGPWAVRVNNAYMGDSSLTGNNILTNVLFVSNMTVPSGGNMLCDVCIIGVQVDLVGTANLGLTGCTVPGTINVVSGTPSIFTDSSSLKDATIVGSPTIILADQALYVSYDNTTSGLTAVNVQAAIDELATGGAASGPLGAVQYSGGGGVFASDNANLSYDPATVTFKVGDTASVPFAIYGKRTDVDPTGQSGGLYVQHNTNITATAAPSLNVGMVSQEVLSIDAGQSNAAGGAGLLSSFYRNLASDAGTISIATGVIGVFRQDGTDPAALTTQGVGVIAQTDVQSGTVDSAYDFLSLPNNLTGGTVNNLYGIYISPPNVGVKENFLSGKATIGGTSSVPHNEILKVNGDLSATISVTDTGANAALVSATSNTTVNGSNTTIGINGVAAAIVQAGAENDKEVGGMNFAVTRGDNTDDGILDTMVGATSLLFHQSGAAGVTNNSYGFSSIMVPMQGTITSHYDFYSQRAPAGGTITNHYGVYISNDSATPVQNYLAGITQMGGTTFSPTASSLLDLQSTTGALTVPRMSSADRTALTASNGMIVYDTDLNAMQQYANGAWSGFSGTSSAPAFAKAATEVDTDVTNPGTNVFDGVTLGTGSILLLIGQSDPTQDGPWVFDSSATPLTRTVPGWITTAPQGEQVLVAAGGARWGSTQWFNQTNAVIGTDAITMQIDGFSPAQVPQDMTPYNNGLTDLGSTSLQWHSLWTRFIRSNANLQILAGGSATIAPTGNLILGTANLIWPTADGSAGQAIITDGGGNLSLGTPTIPAAGADQNIQFNTAGTFDGSNNFNWNNTLAQLQIGGTTIDTTAKLTIIGNPNAAIADLVSSTPSDIGFQLITTTNYGSLRGLISDLSNYGELRIQDVPFNLRLGAAGGAVYLDGQVIVNNAAGGTGNQTINQSSGTFSIAAATASITITDSLVSAGSIVLVSILQNDATAVIKNVVPASGSFTINMATVATATTQLGFLVIN